jgi:hypothetical protein
VCDAVGWYAAHLALRSPRRLRFDLLAHRDASNAELLKVLEAAAATLGLVPGLLRLTPGVPQRRHG